MRAAIYSRFSMERQSEASIVDQERVCTEHAARQGWQVVEHYSDAAISGGAMGNRPGFLRMREAAMARRFDVLLLIDTTRLARSQELAPLIDRLRYQGVRVIGVQDAFDSAAGTADMQAGLSGIMSVEFRRMIKMRTHAALESRAKERKPTGGKAYGYRDGKVDAREAAIVREIFSRYADGASTRTIAAELNKRGVPSPGSTWARTERRAAGWAGSGVRVLLRNSRYAGRVVWNASRWEKNPDTGRRKRVVRPRSEWITHVDPSQRIVSDELWSRAQQRIARTTENGNWARPKGKPKHLLSGLLRCASCGGHYVIANRHEYSCSGFRDGGACDNGIKVRRDVLEDAILGPVRRELLSPERVRKIAGEMERYFRERVQAMQTRAAEVPKELQELGARIERLRDRLRKGDPDLTADELQGAIDKAEGKRAELLDQQPAARQSAKMLAVLPKAADLYRRQIELGLEGDERAALKARVFLRELLGRIDLKREGKSELWAEYGMQPAALLQVVGLKGLGFSGSGGRI